MAAAFAVSFLRGASQPRPVTLASSSPGRPGATRGSGVVSSSTSSTAVSAVQRLFALGLGLLSAASFRRASGRAGFGRIIVRGRNFETNIKKKKGPAEAKQARATAKHLRNISMCVREFGANPEVNRALKRAIQAALKDNVPRDTVNNRIKLITEGKSAVSEIQISGVGPQGTAVIVECLTDNANRTRAAVKTIMKGTLHCIDDVEDEIARMAVEMNSGLLEMAQSLGDEIPVDKLVDKLVTSMRTKDSVSDSMVVHTACLQWICMLLAQSPKKMLQRRTLQRLFTPIFESLVHPDDEVVVASLRVLAQIMEGAAIGGSEQELFDEEFFDDGGEEGGAAASAPSSSSAAGRPAWNVPSSSPSAGAAVVSPSDSRGGSDLFTMVVHRLLKLFASKTQMLETRGRLMIRQLCGHLDPRRLYVTVAQAIQQEPDLVFAQQLVQTFSWILLTAAETRGLREELLQEAQHPQLLALAGLRRPLDEASAVKESVTSDIPLFLELLEPWFHNPVSALALCLWSQQYELASELTARFAAFEPTLDLLRQLDQLVHLIESPVFSRLRLRLLEPRRHPALIKCLLGLAMLLPQAGAFNILRERITVVQSGLLLEAQRDDAPDRSEAVPASPTWWSGSGRPAPSQPAKDIRQIDVRGWIQRFDQVSAEYQC